MIAVIFEVYTNSDQKQDYLDQAALMKSMVESIDGFISIERFESLYETGKILSLSFFENEEAVTTWRNTLEHRKAQALGRNKYFKDYRLRIATVSRDYGMHDRQQVPADSLEIHK